jgi:hypothetical protein
MNNCWAREVVRRLARVTANPCGAHGIPADHSPSGSRIISLRNNDPSTDAGALFVVNTNGSGLRRITAPDFAETLEAGPRMASGSYSAAGAGRCSWSIRTAPGSGRSGSTQAPAAISSTGPYGRPTAPGSCSACSSPAPAGSILHRMAGRFGPAAGGQHSRQRGIRGPGAAPAGWFDGLGAPFTYPVMKGRRCEPAPCSPPASPRHLRRSSPSTPEPGEPASWRTGEKP